MKPIPPELLTAIHIKTAEDAPWPETERMFYRLTRDGLFVCGNADFYHSCVPARGWPSELAPQRPFLKLRYPKVPQPLFERAVGFCARIGELHNAEAAVLLALHRSDQRFQLVIPPQVSVVSSGWSGRAYPLEVHYDAPPLPPDWVWWGDIHSHVDGPAYASHTDKADEAHRPGIHVVIGRIYLEPPDLHIEAIVDGFRFKIEDPTMVIEGYHKRRDHEVPRSWLAQVSVMDWADYRRATRADGENHPVTLAAKSESIWVADRNDAAVSGLTKPSAPNDAPTALAHKTAERFGS